MKANPITQERCRLAVAKIELALGYCPTAQDYTQHPHFRRAFIALSQLKHEVESPQGTPLELIGLSPSTVRALVNCEVKTVEELAAMTDDEMMGLERISGWRFRDIQTRLEECGYR